MKEQEAKKEKKKERKEERKKERKGGEGGEKKEKKFVSEAKTRHPFLFFFCTLIVGFVPGTPTDRFLKPLQTDERQKKLTKFQASFFFFFFLAEKQTNKQTIIESQAILDCKHFQVPHSNTKQYRTS